MSEFFYNIALGVIQGATELLPISSSGHMILFDLVSGKDPSQSLLIVLHFASALALLILYFKEYLSLLLGKNPLQKVSRLIIALIPIALVGVVWGDTIEQYLYNSTFIGMNLLFWGVVMILIEKREEKMKFSEEISNRSAILIGAIQVLALLPGTSRSGVTTIGGMLNGVSKPKALEFSFMVGIPLLLGTFIYKSLFSSSFSVEISSGLLVAFTATFFSTLLAGFLLKKYSSRKFLTLFGYYRIVAGIVVLLVL